MVLDGGIDITLYSAPYNPFTTYFSNIPLVNYWNEDPCPLKYILTDIMVRVQSEPPQYEPKKREYITKAGKFSLYRSGTLLQDGDTYHMVAQCGMCGCYCSNLFCLISHSNANECANMCASCTEESYKLRRQANPHGSVFIVPVLSNKQS